MKEGDLIASMEIPKEMLLLNVYVYQHSLVGILEDPDYLQLFEMSVYGTPQAYFAWRNSVYAFYFLLDVKGKPFFTRDAFTEQLTQKMLSVQEETGIPIRRWYDYLGKSAY